ncbi:MAG: hypothetical protein U0169_12220 [Polyangiaceae bacterium]
MVGGAYRDVEAVLRSRVLELREVVRFRESRVPVRLVPFVPEDLASALAAARTLAATEGDDAGTLQLVVDALSELVRLLDVLHGRLPELEAAWAETGDDPPAPTFPDTLGTALFGFPDGQPALRAFEALVRSKDPHARFERRPDLEFVSRFRHRGVPFALAYRVRLSRAALYFDNRYEWVAPTAGDYFLATTAPNGSPAMSLRPQFPHHAIGKWFGFVEDLELGDPDVDGAFLVRGGREDVTTFVAGPFRDRLLQIARSDVPWFELAPGSTTLRWTFETDTTLLGHALAALTHVRAAVLGKVRTGPR